MTQNIIISKFGGTSMANFEAMERSANIAIRQKSGLIVVSAVFGITNDLISLFEITKSSNKNSLEKILYSIKEKHLDIIYSLNEYSKTLERFNLEFVKLEQLAKGLLLLKEFNDSVYDQLLSFGERFSSLIFTEVLSQKANTTIKHIDSRDFIITDHFFSHASPLPKVIKERIKSLTFEVPLVAGGFIGSTEDGRTTTIGRGGSDYTAALYAEALNAQALEIWTDVDGISSCDPRIIKEAKRIEEISYKEASELAFYGAKVLHPITIQPVKRKAIPIFVGSTQLDQSHGTWISESPKAFPKIRAIAIRADQVLLKITKNEIYRTHEFLIKLVEIFETNKIDIDTLQISETTFAVSISKSNIKITEQIRNIALVEFEKNLSLISFVGHEISNQDRLKADILSFMSDTNIYSINTGASESSFTVLIETSKTQKIVQQIHSKYL